MSVLWKYMYIYNYHSYYHHILLHYIYRYIYTYIYIYIYIVCIFILLNLICENVEPSFHFKSDAKKVIIIEKSTILLNTCNILMLCREKEEKDIKFTTFWNTFCIFPEDFNGVYTWWIWIWFV